MNIENIIVRYKIILKKQKNIVFEYLNPYVLFSYACCVGVLVLNVFIYTKTDYRFGLVINSISTVLVMLLSRIFLGETVTKNALPEIS